MFSMQFFFFSSCLTHFLYNPIVGMISNATTVSYKVLLFMGVKLNMFFIPNLWYKIFQVLMLWDFFLSMIYIYLVSINSQGIYFLEFNTNWFYMVLLLSMFILLWKYVFSSNFKYKNTQKKEISLSVPKQENVVKNEIFSFEDSNSDSLKNIKHLDFNLDTMKHFCTISDTSKYSSEIFVEYFILFMVMNSEESFNNLDTSLVEPNWKSKVLENSNIMNYTECLLNALMSKEEKDLKKYLSFLSNTGLLSQEVPVDWVMKTLSDFPKFMSGSKGALLSFMLVKVLISILGSNKNLLKEGLSNPLLSFDKYIKHLLLLVIVEATAFNDGKSVSLKDKSLDYTKYIMGLSQVFDEGEKELQLLDLFPKIYNSMSGESWYSSKFVYVKFGVESFHIKSKNYMSSYMSVHSKSKKS